MADPPPNDETRAHPDPRSEERAAARLLTLGRMAEGIAHDFNNLLTVMVGYSEEVLEQLPADHEARRGIEQVREAAQRSTVLTRQLLSFRRGEGGDPEEIDVSRSAANLEHLLRRVLAPRFELTTAFAEPLPKVRIAPERLEQAIVHLVLGARDALPGAGRVELSTASHGDGARVALVARAQTSEDTPAVSAVAALGGDAGGAVLRAIAEEARGTVEDVTAEVSGGPGGATWALRLELPAL